MSNHSYYVGANVNPDTNTFRNWMEKTNKVIYDLSTGVVMVTANSTGETTSGNGYIEGNFGADVLIAGNALRGGTVDAANTLNISSEVSIANTLSVANGITGDLTGTASNATNLNNQPGSYYTNATNIDSGTVNNARLNSANTSQSGIVQLVDSIANTSITHAATANSVKAAYDQAAVAAATAYTNAIAIAANADNLASGTVPAARLRAANTTVTGIVQLVDSVTNTSITIAATANSAKRTYDAAIAANTLAANAHTAAANASYLSNGTVDNARLNSANTTQAGIVQLVDGLSNTSVTHAATANAVAQLYELFTTGEIPAEQLPEGNTTAAGIVQLVDSVTSTSIILAATANSVKRAYDAAITANTLAANAHTAAANATYLSNGTVNNARLNAANTTQAGIVQLVDSVANTSITHAPAANSVKTAYDAAIAANTLAANAHTAAANASYLSNGTVNNARLNSANTSQSGIVQLSDSLSSTSIVLAATANSVKQAYDAAVAANALASSANDLAANAHTAAANGSYISNGTVAGARMASANSTVQGAVIIVNSVSNTSITAVAAANNVKTAYDAAIAANTLAANAHTAAANASYLSNGTVAVARLPTGNATSAGVVTVLDSVTNTSILIAASANSVKTAYDAAIAANTLAANAHTAAANGSYITNGTVAGARMASANSTVQGAVIVLDSVTNTSITIAASANSVKRAYDAAVTANTNASNASFLASGTVPTARLATTLQNLINSSDITGTVTVSTSDPSGGADGDIWLKRSA